MNIKYQGDKEVNSGAPQMSSLLIFKSSKVWKKDFKRFRRERTAGKRRIEEKQDGVVAEEKDKKYADELFVIRRNEK